MKLLQATLATFVLGIGLAHAGPFIDKNPVISVDPSCPCFFPGFEVGAFVGGYLPTSGEDALGGGVSLTYFFTENLGLDYSYSVYATESEKHINALDLLYRIPLGNSCWAPYFLGGGAVFSNSDNNGAFRLGGGVEWRMSYFAMCPAVFTDATYNWVDGGSDAVQVRLGFRVPF